MLKELSSPQVRLAITQLYAVLDQTVQAQAAAHHLLMSAARAFPQVALLRTAPGVGPIGASRFVADVQTPHRFSSKRKLWRYCRLGVSHRTSDGKPLRHRQLDDNWTGRGADACRMSRAKRSKWPCVRGPTTRSSELTRSRSRARITKRTRG